jgi:hypothetical protein
MPCRPKSELSPYRIKGRLADIIAAVQVMAARARPEGTIKDLANELSRSRDERTAERWTRVFEEHPEFFLTYRLEGQQDLKAALRWRYVNKLYDPKTDKSYTQQEKEALPAEQQSSLTTRPLAGDQIATLMNTAIELHSRAVEEEAAARWWVPIVAAFPGFVGAVLGAVLVTFYGCHK